MNSQEARKDVLSEAQRSTLEAVTERLIPGDAQDPGAREAGVVNYILLALGGDYADSVDVYAQELDALDRHAREVHGKGFAELQPGVQDDILRSVEKGDVTESLARFFALVLKHTIEGMFGDPLWGGNKDYVGWKLLGYPGPRYAWSVAEQEIDVVVSPRYGDPGPPAR